MLHEFRCLLLVTGMTIGLEVFVRVVRYLSGGVGVLILYLYYLVLDIRVEYSRSIYSLFTFGILLLVCL